MPAAAYASGLVCHPLQGTALASLQTFFQTLVASKAKSASFEALLSALLAAGHDKQVGKTAQHNIAQCIAVLCTAAGPSQTSTTVKSLLSAVEGNDEVASRLALFSLGEIGRCTDLSKFKQLQVCLSFAVRPVLQRSGILDSSWFIPAIYTICSLGYSVVCVYIYIAYSTEYISICIYK